MHRSATVVSIAAHGVKFEGPKEDGDQFNRYGSKASTATGSSGCGSSRHPSKHSAPADEIPSFACVLPDAVTSEDFPAAFDSLWFSESDTVSEDATDGGREHGTLAELMRGDIDVGAGEPVVAHRSDNEQDSSYTSNEDESADYFRQEFGTFRPPLLPGGPQSQESPGGRFDGEWVLTNPTEDTAQWLHRLTIRGDDVVDGEGLSVELRDDEGSKYLCGGHLRSTRHGIARLGKSGGVQVYLRGARESD